MGTDRRKMAIVAPLGGFELPVVTVAILAAVLGFAFGLGSTKLLNIVKPRPPELVTATALPPGSEADRERFFRFTWLVLDVLPRYLRVHFKLAWDQRYDGILPAWRDTPADGNAFWQGVYHQQPFGLLQMVAGEYTASVVEGDATALVPPNKIKVEGQEFRIVALTKGNRLHLNHKAAKTGVFAAYNQLVSYERNCDPRMCKMLSTKFMDGSRQGWDTTMLCFALLQSSHSLVSDVGSRVQVEAVRSLRNNKLAHIKSCCLLSSELEEAVNCMDSYVSGNLPSALCSEWLSISRQVLHEIQSVPRVMALADSAELEDVDENGTSEKAIQPSPSQLQSQRESSEHDTEHEAAQQIQAVPAVTQPQSQLATQESPQQTQQQQQQQQQQTQPVRPQTRTNGGSVLRNPTQEMERSAPRAKSSKQRALRTSRQSSGSAHTQIKMAEHPRRSVHQLQPEFVPSIRNQPQNIPNIGVTSAITPAIPVESSLQQHSLCGSDGLQLPVYLSGALVTITERGTHVQALWKKELRANGNTLDDEQNGKLVNGTDADDSNEIATEYGNAACV